MAYKADSAIIQGTNIMKNNDSMYVENKIIC